MILALPIINEINDRLGYTQLETIENTDPTAEQRKVVTLFNRVLRTMQGIDDWPMLRRQAEIQLLAEETSSLTSGSEQYVVATLNSKDVTVNNMTFDDTYKTRAFQMAGENEVYRIAQVQSPTQITLDRGWRSESTTAVDERTFVIAQDRYALADDFDRSVGDIQSFFSPYDINPIDPNKFQARRAGNVGIKADDPDVFTVYDMNEGQTTELLHFHPYPKNARLLPYSYQAVHPKINSDQDKILYPVRYIDFILEACTELALRHYEDSAKAERSLAEMIRQYNWQAKTSTETLMRMRAPGDVRQSFQRAYGVGGLRINWGRGFDKAGNVNLD